MKISHKSKAVLKRKGFTLIEMIVVIVLMGILIQVAIGTMTTILSQSFGFQIYGESLRSNALVIQELFGQACRNIADNKSITVAQSNQFGFINTNTQSVLFSVSGNTFLETQAGVPFVLATHVVTVQFSYYDDQANLLNAPVSGTGNATPIRLILCTVALQNQSRSITVNIEARPRNLVSIASVFP